MVFLWRVLCRMLWKLLKEKTYLYKLKCSFIQNDETSPHFKALGAFSSLLECVLLTVQLSPSPLSVPVSHFAQRLNPGHPCEERPFWTTGTPCSPSYCSMNTGCPLALLCVFNMKSDEHRRWAGNVGVSFRTIIIRTEMKRVGLGGGSFPVRASWQNAPPPLSICVCGGLKTGTDAFLYARSRSRSGNVNAVKQTKWDSQDNWRPRISGHVVD